VQTPYYLKVIRSKYQRNNFQFSIFNFQFSIFEIRLRVKTLYLTRKSLGAGECFDILGFHPIARRPYFIQEPIIKDSIKRMKEIQSEYRNRWPLWITEIGQPSYDEIDEEKQAKIAEMLLKTAKENQIPVVWFHFSDEIPASEILGWGLVRKTMNQNQFWKYLKNL
jgi:Tat protein secretion system quality control protein TatD with DNase activity